MAARDDLTWHEINDFSPGIWSRTSFQSGRAAPLAPPGAANTNTHSCIGLPSGALGPLPARGTYIPDALPGLGGGVTFALGGFNAELSYALMDPPGDTDQDDRSELHFGVMRSDSVFRWYRYRAFDVNGGWEQVATVTTTATTPRYAPIFHTRINPSDPDEFGQIVTVMTYVGNPFTPAEGFAKAFPSPSTPTTVSSINVGDAASHSYVFSGAHQGRIVFNRFIGYNRGPDMAVSVSDNWYWTQTNDDTLATGQAAFVFENPQGITDFFSMTANELFVVKSVGGGFMVQGDLDDPTLIQLPNVVSPNDRASTVKGCQTSVGVVYSAGQFGMYLWNGGDEVVDIAPQLDTTFCIPDHTMEGHKGQCARWGKFVVAPLSWLYDTETRAWWRLHDPSLQTVPWWSASGYNGILYGAPHTVAADGLITLSRFDPLVATREYTWESHSFPFTRERHATIRHVSLLAQGADQTIIVTFIDEDGNESAPVTLALDSPDEPKILTGDVGAATSGSFSGHAIRMRLDVDGTPADSPAALIHRASVGYYPAQSVA